ncbi:MAG: ribonuclease Z [Algibacter sp.]
MILSQNGNISIITQEKATIIELVKKIEALYPKFKNNNVIVNLTSLGDIKNKEVVEFLQLSNTHRATSHSFVIVSTKINLDDSVDELIIVPTIQEAYDIIEMEDMERDLGL